MEILKKYDVIPVALAILGIVIGFALGWYFRGPLLNQSQSNQDTKINLPENPKESIAISDQDSGESVMISHVVVSEDSWIAVREVVDGTMGNILGAGRLSSGEYFDVSIPLLRPTSPSGEYSAVIYKDNGSGEFEYNFDFLVTDGSKPISASFKTF